MKSAEHIPSSAMLGQNVQFKHYVCLCLCFHSVQLFHFVGVMNIAASRDCYWLCFHNSMD